MNTSAKKQIIPELLAAVLWGILTLWTDRLFSGMIGELRRFLFIRHCLCFLLFCLSTES